eukprot:scaffold15296_cov114-Cylindrotheca_fusiformis.AAC.1
MKTGTSPITAALHNDASDSAPLSGPESRSKKDRGILIDAAMIAGAKLQCISVCSHLEAQR